MTVAGSWCVAKRMSPGVDPAHFNRPTDIAVRPDGGSTSPMGTRTAVSCSLAGTDLTYVREWGANGTGPGDFVIPHAITARNDRVYVADRENDRVEVFDSAGTWLQNWSPVGRAHVYAVATECRWLAAGGRAQRQRGHWRNRAPDPEGNAVQSSAASRPAMPTTSRCTTSPWARTARSTSLRCAMAACASWFPCACTAKSPQSTAQFLRELRP